MATNIGQQQVTVKWSDIVSSEIANRIGKDVRHVGVYSGGWLKKIDNNTISISPLTCEIKDITGKYQVNVETNETVSVPNTGNQQQVTPTRNNIVLRWTRTSNLSTEFLEFLAVTNENILPNDILVGNGVYTGSVLNDTFDYTTRRCPSNLALYLRVEPSFYNPLKFQVRKGWVKIPDGNPVMIADGTQTSNNITVPSTGYLVQLIQVTKTGVIEIHPATSENYRSGKITLARITVISGTTSTANIEIEDLRSFIDYPYEKTPLPLSYLDIDGTLAANSNEKVSTQKAVKTYVDGKIATELFKETVVGWSMPNYAAAYGIGSGTFTAPSNGYLCMRLGPTPGRIRGNIGNIDFDFGAESGNYKEGSSAQYALKKGQVVANLHVDRGAAWFVPCYM